MTSRILCQSLSLLIYLMGYLMLLIERTFYKDLKTEESSEISLSTQKM